MPVIATRKFTVAFLLMCLKIVFMGAVRVDLTAVKV